MTEMSRRDMRPFLLFKHAADKSAMGGGKPIYNETSVLFYANCQPVENKNDAGENGVKITEKYAFYVNSPISAANPAPNDKIETCHDVPTRYIIRAVQEWSSYYKIVAEKV